MLDLDECGDAFVVDDAIKYVGSAQWIKLDLALDLGGELPAQLSFVTWLGNVNFLFLDTNSSDPELKNPSLDLEQLNLILEERNYKTSEVYH